MATGLVKWWRTRFLAGYKPFSVVGGIAEGSDSEELLSASVPSNCNSTSSPPSAALNSTTPISESSPSVSAPSSSSSSSSSVPVGSFIPETLLPEPLIPEILAPSSGKVSPTAIINNPVSSSSSVSSPTITATTPAVVSSTTNNYEQQAVSNTRQFSFEEFECDVSVAEDNRRRQEFSFTLYDFDGHGKITKDDIAGLVTSIYDSLGTSIEVPPCGSKTIKVKLTVSPDKNVDEAVGGVSSAGGGALASAAGAVGDSGETQTPAVKKTPTVLLPTTSVINASTSCCHIKPVKSCSHATHASRRVPRRRRILRNRAQTELVAEWHSEEDVDNVPGNISKQEEIHRRVGGGSVHVPTPYSNSSEGDVSDDSDFSSKVTPFTPLVTTNHRKRSGSMQRQQLLEIIQANMEKNNLSFHASRKRHQSEHLRVPPQRPYAGVSPMSPMYVQTSSRPPSASRQPPPAYHKPVREYSHHHATSLSKLPAKARDNQRKIQNHHSHTTHFTSSIDTNITVPTIITATTPTHHHHHQQQQQQQQQPNSNSNSNKHHYRNNLQSTIMTTPPTAVANTLVGHNIFNTESIQKNHINQRNNEHAHQNYVQSLKQQKTSVNNNSKGSKKHQLKHATREQEQARAMQQVVRWLEQEFSSQNPDNDNTSNAGRRHVHEHIHHHYHHYHADPLV